MPIIYAELVLLFFCILGTILTRLYYKKEIKKNYQQKHAFNQEAWNKAYDSAITFGRTTFSLLALINGGAAAAILAATTAKSSINFNYLLPTLLSFLLGAILACFGCAFAYLAEYKTLMKLEENVWYPLVCQEVLYRHLGVLFGVFSLLAMATGFYLGITVSINSSKEISSCLKFFGYFPWMA